MSQRTILLGACGAVLLRLEQTFVQSAPATGWLRQAPACPAGSVQTAKRRVPDGFGWLRHGWSRLAPAGSGKS